MKDSNLQSRILNLVKIFFKGEDRDSLAIQWLGPHTFTAEGQGSIPSGGAKSLQAA